MLRSIVIGVSCASAFAIVGCAEPPESSGPTSACRVDSECSGEMLCNDGQCVAPEGEEEESESSAGDEDESDDGPQTSPGGGPGQDNAEGGDDAPACTESMCQSDDTIALCEGGSPVVYGCDFVCSDNALGPAVGCGVGDAGSDVCFCEPAGEVCGPAGTSCSANIDCCDVGTTSAGCINFPDGSACADKCETNAGCAAGCCQPITSDGVPTGYGACSDPGFCVQGACGLAQCDYEWCGTVSANDCPADWFGDGSCDCGCQFNDIDCG